MSGDNEKNPFEGFTNQHYNDGQAVEEKPDGPEQKPQPNDGTSDEAVSSEEDAGHDSAVSDPYDLSEFSDPEDVDEDVSDDDDGDPGDLDEDDEDQDDEEAAQDEDSGEKRRENLGKKARKRIDALTRKSREAERRAEAAEARLAELTRQQEQPAQPDQGEDGSSSDKKASNDDVDTSDLSPPDPNDPKYKYGEVDSQYLSDMVDYNVEVRLRKQQAADEKTRRETAARQEAEKLNKAWLDLGDKGLEAHDDFKEVVFDGANAGKWSLSKEMAFMIPQSEVGANIAYHLARNPKESARVAGLPPFEQARYFGRIEAKFLAQKRANGETGSDKMKRTKAPRKQPRGSGGRFTRTDAGGDFAEFEKRVKQNEARSAGR